MAMLEVAKQKYLEEYKGKLKSITFIQNDASALDFPSNSFDTVIDTFGLCACTDPTSVIEEMARVCKPGGNLIFIEHGRGHYDWFNLLIDKEAPTHAKNWGCWWNRSIDTLLRASVDVVVEKRFHLGTSYFVIANKKQSL